MMKNKKGASLIWGVILCMVLFIVSATVSNSIISESRTSVRMDDSARAYAAAESGIEWARYYTGNNAGNTLFNETGCPTNVTEKTFIINYLNEKPVEYKVTLKAVNNDCIISSLGTSNKTNRKLEYKITPSGFKSVAFNLATVFSSIPGSYTQQFNIWQGNKLTGSTNGIDIGLKDPSNRNISMRYASDASGSIISLVVNGVESTEKIKVSATEMNLIQTEPYSLQVKIEYLRGTAVKLSVYKRVSGVNQCVGTTTSGKNTVISSVEGGNYSTLNSFYLAPSASISIGDAGPGIGDGSDVKRIYPLVAPADTYLYIDNMATKGIVY